MQNYRKQRNKCAKVLRNTKQQYFNNLNSKSIADTNTTSITGTDTKTVKPLFSNKSKTANTIILHENYRRIKNNKKISYTLNKYFTNLPKTLKLRKTSPALKKKSLKHLKSFYQKNSEICTFREFKKTEIIKTIKELPKNKLSTFKDIPVKIMVNSVHIYSPVLTSIFNDCVKSGNFPDILKDADIARVFKKGYTTDKTNYRPISTFSNFSNFSYFKSF